MPWNFGAGFGARSRGILSRLIRWAKAKVRDEFDFAGAWLHGSVVKPD
jgi:hypothetical protein